jgi:hypothetical protein
MSKSWWTWKLSNPGPRLLIRVRFRKRKILQLLTVGKLLVNYSEGPLNNIYTPFQVEDLKQKYEKRP